jgi:excisionase family DNA binding protein
MTAMKKINEKPNMKTEQNAGQPAVVINGQTYLPSGGMPERSAGSPLASREATPVPTSLAMSNPEPLFYDIKQTAFALNMCTKTVRRLLARGKLTSCKVLRKILIPREQIAGFLKATCDKPNFNA